MTAAPEVVKTAGASAWPGGSTQRIDCTELRSSVRSAVSSYLFKTMRRSPMVIPAINRV